MEVVKATVAAGRRVVRTPAGGASTRASQDPFVPNPPPPTPRSLAHYLCQVSLHMVRPAAALVAMVDPVANAGVVETLEARLADSRKCHDDGKYGTIPWAIAELGIRAQWATEHPSRPAYPRPVRNDGGVDNKVDGGARVGGNDGMQRRGVIKVDGGVDRIQVRVQRLTAAAGSSRAGVNG
ncbi:unnamed protein product [Closterium sp. NIES-54]